ncbi:hypothetical protein RFI_17699 [Reticulomyxa filosa]|uniref:Uncharacterized protein n=1 Tax=Reticulomyxa filosa TaxID=46433 RepID=X6N0U7_RETFI|nr:hypothetical protein RFI_17699 [Reticulomyxa filosa]|eukprot:ETO19533.1 hypothetical protein RFI_17699 [Reticulomyxa filosa]
MVFPDLSTREDLILFVCGVFGITCNSVLILDTIKNGLTFYKHKDYVVLKKRYGLITLHELVYFLGHSLSQIGYFISFQFIDIAHCKLNSSNFYLFNIPLYMSMLAGVAYLFCWCWRYWLSPQKGVKRREKKKGKKEKVKKKKKKVTLLQSMFFFF